MTVDKHDAKAFVRLRQHGLKPAPHDFYASTIDSKLARTFTDDADLYHGLRYRRKSHDRPGQRDDGSRCAFGAPLPV
jgi:hypothetical protein